MENIGMEKNAGKEGECSGKTKERKNTGKKQEEVFGTQEFVTQEFQSM